MQQTTPPSTSSFIPIRRALISVSDKTGIVEFAQALYENNVELISTGGTASLLREAGLTVVDIADYTGFPEMMAGRVKTLHPKIHGGILARRNQDEAIMAEHNIQAIDMVVVNLYPFAQTVAKADCSLEEAIENIDIGGPTMVRSAAKNHKDVAIVVKNSDYLSIINELKTNNGALTDTTRFNLAVKAFEHTAVYDSMIANYLGTLVSPYHDDTEQPCGFFPRTINLNYIKKQNMRYGENSHQQAAFYVEDQWQEASVASSQQLQGKPLSYNNIADSDAALECIKAFSEPACVIVKHANPCGVAISDAILSAYEKAYKTDPTSAFGGIIAFNRELDADTATTIIAKQFVEVIIAPSVSESAKALLATKKNVRVLVCGQWHDQTQTKALDFKRVNGGLLVQERDLGMVTETDLQVVSQRQPNPKELRDALFSWKVAKFVKSNAIVYARDNMTIGIGAGQMSRVYSAKIASIKATDEKLAVKGAVMASDAFFPFRDAIDEAAAVGISCIIQPGGSLRDQEVIAAANEHNIAMIFTGMRHFRH